jgi:3-deoxy-D-manno-octulosonic-acid transferase
VNARLSDRGFRRARRFRWLALRCWRGITHVLAGSATDAQRFRDLGFSEHRVHMTGSIKLDVDFPRLTSGQRDELRRELGLGSGLIIVAASTWAGEESVMLELLQTARSAGVDARLLLVPRHVERRGELATLLATSNFSHHFRSQGVAPGDVDVAIGDTTGELRQFLQFADVVFVGRSLPPHAEGQTPIEAALLEKPVLFGPGMSNFQDIASGMVAAGVAVQVAGPKEICDEGTALLRDGDRRRRMATAAQAWAQSNRGAIGRTIAAIKNALDEHYRA